MLETILIVLLIACSTLLALPVLAIGFAFYQGWFTLPGPGPDRERIKTPQALPLPQVRRNETFP